MREGLRFGRTIRGAVASALLSVLGPGCGSSPAELHVLSAQEVGVLPQSSRILGRDGGPSALVWGHSVWTFGDTVLAMADAAGSNWHHNSFSITDDPSAQDGIGPFSERTDSAGAPIYFIAPTSEEASFNSAHAGNPCAQTPCGARFAAWPGAPIWDPSRSRALAFYGLIYAEPGSFNFHGVGQGLALWTSYASQPERPVVDPTAPHPTLLFQQSEPNYGEAALTIADDLLAFACSKDFLAYHCTLGKVPLGRPLDRSAWRVFDGTSWSPRLADARALFDAGPNLSVFYDSHLSRWVAAYSAVLSNDVMGRTAPDITGPWSAPQLLFVAHPTQPNSTVYDALVHPEFSQEEGRILYFTHSRSTGVGWFGAEFALVRVELE